jgi:hypothetical protein
LGCCSSNRKNVPDFSWRGYSISWWSTHRLKGVFVAVDYRLANRHPTACEDWKNETGN